ncbi:MAG: hypothetical protein LBF61_10835 [Azoarcus sp.]|jgi:type II secretory pathway component PulF|nr:hypothetical protein [Azoarcus sp.]
MDVLAERQNGDEAALREPALVLLLGAAIASIIVAILLGILSVNELAG